MRRRKSALIKSNNPHLAGGEPIVCFHIWAPPVDMDMIYDI